MWINCLFVPVSILEIYTEYYKKNLSIVTFTLQEWYSQRHYCTYKHHTIRLYRPWGFQEVEAPRFRDNRHRKMVMLSALRTGRLYLQEIFLVLISIRDWVDLRVTVRTEGLCQWEVLKTPSGIEPVTFRLVAQCESCLLQYTSIRIL